MVHGPKWSAKSTFLEVIKRLIDPSSKWLLQLPWDSNGLIHTFLNDYLLCYDNISKISHETSDDLCRAVSGASLSKRKLHTDSEDIIYSFRKAICINGINLEANQPDLLQRSVILQLEAVQKRIPSSTFWRNFEKDLPSILWGIFDIIVRAISIEKTLLDDDWAFERLADFHKWGEAICQAMWNSPWLFSELLKENTDSHDEVALSSNIATSILLEFMKTKSYWEWTATELRNELYFLASSRSETRFLPATAHTLMNTLNRFKENLEHVGISIVSSKSWTRLVQISNKSCDLPYSKDPFST
jgi:energy-coupling factor transporter ATP-binding protein EcfA2